MKLNGVQRKVLQIAFLSMSCAGAKKGCNTKRCSCQKANLPCTELCQCSECENMQGCSMEEDDIIDYGLDEDVDGTLHDEF